MSRLQGSLLALAVAATVSFMAALWTVSADIQHISWQAEEQTKLLQQIATNTTQPIRSETTITKVDQGVCATLSDALKGAPKTDTKKGKK